MTTTTTAATTTPATATKATMIRPGLMVLVRSSVAGGVNYRRVDLDAPDSGAELGVDITEEGPPSADEAQAAAAAVTRWETTKVVDDPAEFARASKVRNQARGMVRKVCASTSFGMLCPEAREEELDAAIDAARALVAAHNATAKCTHVQVYALKGRIASDDRQAVRIISAEVRDLVADMSASIDRLDVKGIREAADKAREVGAMLAPEQSAIVADAVKQARAAARQIVARVEGKAEDAKVVLADVQRGSIEKARIAFLDLDDGPGVVGAALPPVNVQRFADMGEDAATVEGQVA